MSDKFSDVDYEQLLVFRDSLRRFLRRSEQCALEAGITPAQHQLLLAIRGHPDGAPTINEVADHLLLRPNSVTELVDRAVVAGLVRRQVDPGDSRVVRLRLTRTGTGRLAALAAVHVHELSRLGPIVAQLGRSDVTAVKRRLGSSSGLAQMRAASAHSSVQPEIAGGRAPTTDTADCSRGLSPECVAGRDDRTLEAERGAPRLVCTAVVLC